MPNIFHQTVEDILRAATPEQRILWNHVFLRFGERCAISQFVYTGNAGEIQTYVARKLYLGYEIQVGTNAFPSGVTAVGAVFYDENNVACFGCGIASPAWDATAASMRYSNQLGIVNNLIFSRVMGTGVFINFKGYRIIY